MIVRTLIIEDEPLARRTLREFAVRFEWLVLVGEAADGATAISLIDALKPDLVLLDIQLPEASGLEILNAAKHRPLVIFTTAFDRYAIPAFEIDALDYLLKPFGFARFKASVERARRRLEESISAAENREIREDQEKISAPARIESAETFDRLFVRDRSSIVPLKIEDVSRFEADDDYVRIYTENRFYLIHQTLGEIEKRLAPNSFCRVHRSVIVNLAFVERVETRDRRLMLVLKDKTEIIASRAGSQSLRRLIL